MAPTTAELARKLADAEHESDTYLCTPLGDAVFERATEVRDSIPDEVYYTTDFFAAYDERRRERNAECDAGRPFAVIDGGVKP